MRKILFRRSTSRKLPENMRLRGSMTNALYLFLLLGAINIITTPTSLWAAEASAPGNTNKVTMTETAPPDFSGSSVEQIRAKLLDHIDRVGNTDAKQSIAPLLRNDAMLLDIETVANAGSKPDAESHHRFREYAVVWLFRYHNDPKQIERLYDKLSDNNRIDLIQMSYLMLPSFISVSYAPIALKAIVTADAFEGNSRLTLGYLALGYLDKTQDPQATHRLKLLLENQVADRSQRFNNMAYWASIRHGEALPIVEWYFSQCATEPFEMKFCLDFLEKYESKKAFIALATKKATLLNSSLSRIRKKNDAHKQ